MWNLNHPEADRPDLRRYTWQQAAELASVDAEHAAALLTLYELAPDADTAMRRGVILEYARAEAAAELRRDAVASAQAAERERGQLAREAHQLHQQVERLQDRSRAALAGEAQRLAAAHGWGASKVGEALGWPESTVRGWLAAATPVVSAAD
jgi:hypothetical protein